MKKFFEKIGTYFANCLTKSIDIRYNISHTISTLIDVADALFQAEETTYSIIDIVIENLDNIPKEAKEAFTTPDKLHSLLLQILFKIVILHYSNKNFSPDKIFKFVNEKILDYNDPSIDQDIISNYLLFWTDLADYERDIIIKQFKKKKLNLNVKDII